MRLLIFCLALLGVALPACTKQAASSPLSGIEAARWHDPDFGYSVRKGFADAESIWLLGQTGRVVRFDRRSGVRSSVGDGVVDLLSDGLHLWMLATGPDARATLRDLRAHPLADLNVEITGQALGLFPAGGGRPGILTTTAALMPAGSEGWRIHRLAEAFEDASVITADGGGHVYVGLDRGEWGGGLRRIDLATGSVSWVTQRSTELCGGMINPDCDPVVGAFPDPTSTDCINVGVGLAHLTGRTGTLFRVCDQTITRLYSKPIPRTDPFVFGDWPFFGLVQTSDGWIALSDARYFQMRDGVTSEQPLPALHDWSGLKISDERNGVLFVMSACCWGRIDNPTEFSVVAIPILH